LTIIGAYENFLKYLNENNNECTKDYDDAIQCNVKELTGVGNINFYQNADSAPLFILSPNHYSYTYFTETISVKIRKNTGNYWVLGSPVLESYHTILDYSAHKIGFAK
jgi:hypothetical protein